MNFRFIFLIVGIVELIIGVAMAVSGLVGFCYADHKALLMLLCGGVVFALGAVLCGLFRRCDKSANNKTALLLVVIVWLVMCITGAVPYYFTGVFQSYSHHAFLNSLFESTSGFTTTGSSVLGDPYPIESLGYGILFWRSLTHWIGGIGIILMVLSILPMLGSAGMQLFKAEAPGAVVSKIHPRMISTARALGMVYILFTFILIALYLFGGMNIFDAMCTAFGAIATGGFSNKDASIAAFNSPYIEWVTIVFLFIGATSFSLHYSLMKGHPKKYWNSSEFKFYFLWIIGGIVLVISIMLYSGVARAQFGNMHDFVRSVVFQVTSISTATGYVTRNFDIWPWGAKSLLLIMMVFGGCVGSTAGGVKMFRLIILIKYSFREIRRVLQPSLFTAVKYDGAVVQRGVLEGICSFFILYIVIFMVASVVVAFQGMNITDSISAVVTTMGGVGPGLGMVGPVKNFYFVPPIGKGMLVLCMLFGRLEIIPLVALITPAFWRK